MTKIGTAFLYALTLYGTAALPGNKTNELITQYFKDAGHPEIKDDETPWCAAFLNAVLHRCGIETTGSLAAVSFLNWGVEALTPMLGDVVVFDWGGTGASTHHVGFVTASYATVIYVLGGNEEGKVEIRGYDPKYIMQVRRQEE